AKYTARSTMRQRKFKNSEEIERKDENNDAQCEDKIRIGELKPAPGDFATGGFEHDQEERQTDKPGKNSTGKCDPAPQNFLTALPSVLNEAENFERDDRQNTRHQVQNDPTQKTEQKKSENSSRRNRDSQFDRCNRGSSDWQSRRP